MITQQVAIEEARKIIVAAEQRGVRLKLLGGLAFKLSCPSSSHEFYRRDCKDIDIIGRQGSMKAVDKIMKEKGFTAREMFNKLNLGKRLLYFKNDLRVDVFLGEFEMAHKFDFEDDLNGLGLALPITPLVITKLQVFKTTEKEIKDLSAAFTDYEVSNGDDELGINSARIADLCAKDWGIHKTFTMNLEHLLTVVDGEAKHRIFRLLNAIEKEPKTLAWKLRAKIGEKRRWYEEPEEVS